MLTVEFRMVLRPEFIDEFLTVVAPQVLPATRNWDGNEGLALYQDTRDPRRVSVRMSWRTLEDFDLYLEWRRESGTVGRLSEMSAEPPVWVFLEEKIRM